MLIFNNLDRKYSNNNEAFQEKYFYYSLGHSIVISNDGLVQIRVLHGKSGSNSG